MVYFLLQAVGILVEHWRHAMKLGKLLQVRMAGAAVALARLLLPGFADDSWDEKRAWRCDWLRISCRE